MSNAAALAAVLLAQGRAAEAEAVISKWRPAEPAAFDAAVAEVRGLIPPK
jgi:hypothetical protein